MLNLRHSDDTQFANLCQVAYGCLRYFSFWWPSLLSPCTLRLCSDFVKYVSIPRMPHVSPWACIFEHIWNPLNKMSITFWMLFVVNVFFVYSSIYSTDVILNLYCTEVTFWACFSLCRVSPIKRLASHCCFTFSISFTSRIFTSITQKRIYQLSDTLLS